MSIRILGLAGSTRSGSLNKRLVRAALHHAEAGGADTTFLDLRSLEIPLYDGDLEAASGLPEGGVLSTPPTVVRKDNLEAFRTKLEADMAAGAGK